MSQYAPLVWLASVMGSILTAFQQSHNHRPSNDFHFDHRWSASFGLLLPSPEFSSSNYPPNPLHLTLPLLIPPLGLHILWRWRPRFHHLWCRQWRRSHPSMNKHKASASLRSYCANIYIKELWYLVGIVATRRRFSEHITSGPSLISGLA
jgi:hypothetical protein